LETHHHLASRPRRYPALSEWYSILSTTKDRQGIEYVSTMQGKRYPFFGTQVRMRA
jgi:gamma-glutamyl hydrolase